MFQRFTVGNPPPVTTPKPPPVATTRKLVATVGPKNTISLRNAAGAALHHGVKAGTYSIVVRDRSKMHNFHLSARGEQADGARGGRHAHLEGEASKGQLPVRLACGAE